MTLLPDVPIAVFVVHMLALGGLIGHALMGLYRRRALIRQSHEDPQLELEPAFKLHLKPQAPTPPLKPQVQVTRPRPSGSHYSGQPLKVH